jgi:glycosyltransferase involved in cell wall biosynthesis
LSPEKGLGTLIAAWERLAPFRLAGEDRRRRPASADCGAGRRTPRPGRLSSEQVKELTRDAAFLIFLSECYETFRLVAIEAFAMGTPVIAADIGPMGYLAEHGRTGLHLCPAYAEDLAKQVTYALEHPDQLVQMRSEARNEFERKYTPCGNYQAITNIYRVAIENAKSGRIVG